jgi:hypothetical protein
LGLFLDEPRFGSYNTGGDVNTDQIVIIKGTSESGGGDKGRREIAGMSKLKFNEHHDEIEMFKEREIYAEILRLDRMYCVFARWITLLDKYAFFFQTKDFTKEIRQHVMMSLKKDGGHDILGI